MGKAKLYFEEDLKAIPERSAEELESLFSMTKAGDDGALSDFISAMQHRLYRAALLFDPEDELFMDLIQEGNLALLNLISDETEPSSPAQEQWEETIRSAMQRFLSEEAESHAVAEELKVKLNVIDEITMKIAEEENREATAEEIAKLMGLDESDVKYLMRIALSALDQDVQETP